MKLKQCINGHYYDEDRYGDECPHCKANGLTGTVNSSQDLTEALTAVSNDEAPADTSKTQSLEDDDKTIAVDLTPDAAVEPAVGWLVCIKGNNLGRDYRLHAGRNFIGRGSDMDVSLSGDRTVSRTNHAIVVYDSKSRSYLVQPGDSKELFYVNGKVVLSSMEINAYDTLEIGKSNLLFIPLCGADFDWTKLQEEAK